MLAHRAMTEATDIRADANVNTSATFDINLSRMSTMTCFQMSKMLSASPFSLRYSKQLVT